MGSKRLPAGEVRGYDDLMAAFLPEALKDYFELYHMPLDYIGDLPEVDFAMSLSPPGRERMVRESQRFNKVTRYRTVVLQEFPARVSDLDISIFKSGAKEMPDGWGEEWIDEGDVAYVYPFVNKEVIVPMVEEGYILLGPKEYRPGAIEHDQTERYWEVLDELRETYDLEVYQGAVRDEESPDFVEAIDDMAGFQAYDLSWKEYSEHVNRCQLYLSTRRESYGVNLIEAAASNSIVVSEAMNVEFRRAFAVDLSFHLYDSDPKGVIVDALDNYDEYGEELDRNREKVWGMDRTAEAIHGILEEKAR